jgi:hypothetical protein
MLMAFSHIAESERARIARSSKADKTRKHKVLAMLPIQKVHAMLFQQLKTQGFEISTLTPVLAQVTETKDRPLFVITLRPLPSVDPIRSLRGVLKGLLRRHGMRCVDLREIKT